MSAFPCPPPLAVTEVPFASSAPRVTPAGVPAAGSGRGGRPSAHVPPPPLAAVLGGRPGALDDER